MASEVVRSRDAESLWSLVEAYLNQHRGSGSISEHTKRAYMRGIDSLLDRWTDQEILNPTPEAAAEAVGVFEDLGLSLSSMKVYIAGMRALYAALRWAGVTYANPFTNIHLHQGDRDQPERRQAYSAQEIEMLLSVANSFDYVLILLGADAGLRVSECVSLGWSDIDLRSRQVIVHSAGSSRRAEMSERLASALAGLPRNQNGRVFPYATEVRARQRLQIVCAEAGVPYKAVDALRLSTRTPAGATESRGSQQTRSVRRGSLAPGIASASELESEIDRAASESSRSGTAFALLTIELDGLEKDGRPLEPDIQQAALESVAGRVIRRRRGYDFVAFRPPLSFCVLLRNVSGSVDLSNVERRFRSAIDDEPITVRGQRLAIRATTSIRMGDEVLIGRPGPDETGSDSR